MLFKGPQGTFVNNFIVPQLGDTQGLFLKDDSNSESYGNSGFIVEGADIEGPAPLGLSMLFPGSINPGEENDFTNPAVISLELESKLKPSMKLTRLKQLRAVWVCQSHLCCYRISPIRLIRQP